MTKKRGNLIMEFVESGTCAISQNNGSFADLEFKKMLGRGGFGSVYLAFDTQADPPSVAVKVEPLMKGKRYQLDVENEAYLKLSGSTYVPQVYGFGHITDQNGQEYLALKMERMGPSLAALMRKYAPLSLKTLIQLTIQMLHAIEDVHKAGLVHGDIKPSNFVFGSRINNRDRDLCIIDFGTSIPYRCQETGMHATCDLEKDTMGTLNFMSFMAHCGFSKSRRCDLESFCYTLVYLKRQKLPWSDAGTDLQIAQIKQTTTITTLCEGVPTGFQKLFHKISTLKLDEEPDYAAYRNLLKSCGRLSGLDLDWTYEWDEPKA